MIARLLICPDVTKIKEEIQKTLASHLTSGNVKHPDLLYIKTGEKLGIAEARKIKEHFSLKPYSAKGRAAVLEDTSEMTIEAQNALLKTIEELPENAILILGASSASNLLPTILSRCEIINFEARSYDTLEYHNKYIKDLDKLLNSSYEERFEYIEKLKEKEEFLHFLVFAFRETLLNTKPLTKIKNFLDELLQAEQWCKQNVNIRAILEYLMLVMPIVK
ncbi:hypothetical protein HYU95_01795 [Candidatus Daviesbacteria bacterium]|nr:hypothetical protein [Candidatus Daviesbacteria bacterium]